MRIRVALAVLLGAALAAAELPTIAVMPISGGFSRISMYSTTPGHENSPNSFNNRLADRVMMALVRSHRFQVLERTQLANVLEEGHFAISGLADSSRAITMGKQLGAQFVVLGAYDAEVLNIERNPRNCSGTMHIALRVVNTETGVITGLIEVAPTAEGQPAMQTVDAMLNDLGQRLDAVMPDFLEATTLEPPKG